MPHIFTNVFLTRFEKCILDADGGIFESDTNLSLEQEIAVLETVRNISFFSIILELYGEISSSQKCFGIGHMYM
jgi:hypothetical protein